MKLEDSVPNREDGNLLRFAHTDPHTYHFQRIYLLLTHRVKPALPEEVLFRL